MDRCPERPRHPAPDGERTVPPAREGPRESVQDVSFFLHQIHADLPQLGGGARPTYSPAETGSDPASARWRDWPDPGDEEGDGGAGELRVSLHR